MKHVFGAYNSDIDPRDDPFHPFKPEKWSQQAGWRGLRFEITIISNACIFGVE